MVSVANCIIHRGPHLSIHQLFGHCWCSSLRGNLSKPLLNLSRPLWQPRPRVGQKWCCVTSKARIFKCLVLLPYSLRMIALGTQLPCWKVIQASYGEAHMEKPLARSPSWVPYMTTSTNSQTVWVSHLESRAPSSWDSCPSRWSTPPKLKIHEQNQ